MSGVHGAQDNSAIVKSQSGGVSLPRCRSTVPLRRKGLTQATFVLILVLGLTVIEMRRAGVVSRKTQLPMNRLRA